MDTFENQSIWKQIVINFYNRTSRGEEYSIKEFHIDG